MINELIYKLFNDSLIEPINKDNYTTIFKLPIETIEEKIPLDKNIIKDLELLNDNDMNKYSLYGKIFNNKTLFGTTNLDLWCNYYTNNKQFLLDSQTLYKKYKYIKYESIDDDTIYDITTDIIEDEGFIDRFHYIDLPILKCFNKDERILQILAYNNLSSPLLSIIMPIIFLILPFIIIKIQGHQITFEKYKMFIDKFFKNHIIGQLFNNIMHAPLEKKLYFGFSLFIFIFQIYNNINTCKNYYKNIKYVNDTLDTMRIFLTNTVNNIDNFLSYSNNLVTYKKFNDELLYRKDIINKYLQNINKISEYKFDIKKVLQLGYLMKCFYILNNDNNLTETIKYSFGFCGYIENINNLQLEIKNKNINFCKFIDKKDKNKKVTFKNTYFANLNNNNPIKNDITLSNNIIITGPNAAGKTTLLKSILYNTIINQQIGCGFYSKANVKIYDFIHCYINIPDTGDRDSLFQAECRNCKNILNIILNNPDKNHFCVFDELYSGTNPYEAISSAYSYLDFISKYNNINYVLTTHYIGLCKLLESNINKNYYMEIEKTNEDNNYNYKYKLCEGISEIKGGIKVLKDLEYPDEIINNMNTTIEKIIL